MSETSARLQDISETQIVRSFRRALVALSPLLIELDCLENDISLYDPFDRLAESLWNELVVRSLQWKYGTQVQPALPQYGFSGRGPAPDGLIRVVEGESIKGQFICFRGDREFGAELFNTVVFTTPEEKKAAIRLSDSTHFEWVRTRDT